jgi:hypothetical protein
MIHLLSYQLRPFRYTPALFLELQKSLSWSHYLDYTWIVQTPETVEQLYARLAPHFTQQDSFLIVQILPNTPIFGWLPKDAWDWINQRRWL